MIEVVVQPDGRGWVAVEPCRFCGDLHRFAQTAVHSPAPVNCQPDGSLRWTLLPQVDDDEPARVGRMGPTHGGKTRLLTGCPWCGGDHELQVEAAVVVVVDGETVPAWACPVTGGRVHERVDSLEGTVYCAESTALRRRALLIDMGQRWRLDAIKDQQSGGRGGYLGTMHAQAENIARRAAFMRLSPDRQLAILRGDE